MRLIIHVVMPDRNKLLQIIREKSASDIETAYGLLDRASIEERSNSCVGEARINNKQTLNRQNIDIGLAWRRSKEMRNVMICIERLTYQNVSRTFNQFLFGILIYGLRQRLYEANSYSSKMT